MRSMLDVLKRLADAADEFQGSNSDLNSHEATEQELCDALKEARELIGMFPGEVTRG